MSEELSAIEGPAWVRKRSNELVPFQVERLRDAIARAAADVMQPIDEEAADELARMIAFVASRRSVDGVIDARALEEIVVTGLEQVGHGDIARSYRRFAVERQAFRERANLALSEGQLFSEWDKAEIRRWLQSRVRLTEDEASAVARSLERALVGTRIDRITDELVIAVLNALLMRIGCRAQLPAPGRVVLRERAFSLETLPLKTPEVAAWQVASEAWREYGLDHVFTPEVVAAHREGQIHLDGPWLPLQLAGLVVDAFRIANRAQHASGAVHALCSQLARLRPYCGRTLAVDMLDVALALLCKSETEVFDAVELFWRELRALAMQSPVDIVLNLYGRIPPRAVSIAGPGPLFRAEPSAEQHARACSAASFLLDLLRSEKAPRLPVTVDYHWFPQDRKSPTRSATLAVSLATSSGQTRIVFDRYAHPVADGLGGGPGGASLFQVNIDLTTVTADAPGEALETELRRAAELAVQGGVQRREWIRAEAVDTPVANRLQTAALLLCPIGLDEACRQLTGHGIGAHPSAAALAVRIVRTLRTSAEMLGRSYGLEIRIDRSSPRLPRQASSDPDTSVPLPGLTCWAPDRGIREQIHRTGQIHREAGAGTLLMPLKSPAPWPVDHLIDVLNWAWESSTIVRLQFVPVVEETVLFDSV